MFCGTRVDLLTPSGDWGGEESGERGERAKRGDGSWWVLVVCFRSLCVFCSQRRSRLCDAELLLGLLELLLIEKAIGSPLDFDVVGDSGSFYL